MLDEPLGGVLGEGLINSEFRSRIIEVETGLIEDWAGVHTLDKLHDGDAKSGVATENGRLNRGGATEVGKEGGVNI